MRPVESTELGRLPGIDILRGIAALAVVVCHLTLGPGVLGGVHDFGWAIRVVQSTLGAWGVGLFFVISGMCVHLPMARALAHAAEPPLGVEPYLRRRFTRIYPPHLVALFLSAAVAFLVPPAISSLLSAPTFRQLFLHVVLLHSFFPSAINSVSPVFWTIAVEAHFYLLYPLLLPAFRRIGTLRITLGLLLLSLLARVMASRLDPSVISVIESSVVCRLWEWSLGCWIAECVTQPAIPSANAWDRWGRQCGGWAVPGLAVVLSVALQAGFHRWLGADAGRLWANELRAMIWPPLFAAGAYFASRFRTAIEGPLVSSLVRLGHTSYSLYLIHPVALALSFWGLAQLHAPLWLQSGISLLAALFAARLFFQWVELPFWTRSKLAPRE